MKLWNFSWLCKDIEKIRNSQDFILENFCTALSFHHEYRELFEMMQFSLAEIFSILKVLFTGLS